MDEFEPRRPTEHAPPRSQAVRRAVTPTVRSAPSTVGLDGGPVDTATERDIASSSGSPLDLRLRRSMEPLFGRDLGEVRIHRNSEVAPRLGARAFTLGRDIHFAADAYRPDTADGMHVLAHELAHVTQPDRVVHRWVDAAAVNHALGAALDADAQKAILREQVMTSWARTNSLLTANVTKARAIAVRQQVNLLATQVRAAIDALPFVAAGAQASAGVLAQYLNTVEIEVLTEKELSGVDLTNPAGMTGKLNARAAAHAPVAEAVSAVGSPARRVELDNLRAAAQQAVIANPFNQAAATEATARYLDRLATEEEVTAPEHLMQVGTEFTFTSEAIGTLDVLVHDATFDEAIKLIRLWAAKVGEMPLKTYGNKEIPRPDLQWVDLTSANDRRNDGAEDKAAEFWYTFADGSRWWWRINIDYGCLELQAKPTTLKQANADGGLTNEMIQMIVDKHIFGIAFEKVRLRTDPLVGGGHLTIDRATTFGDNARWIRNFLVLYANEARSWRDEDADDFNAPVFTELTDDGRAAFVRVIADFDRRGRTNNPMSADDLGKALLDRVFVKEHFPPVVTTDPRVKAADEKRRGQPTHYQATNFEKWREPVPTERRVEMRHFNAQEDVWDFIKDLQKLANLATRARTTEIIVLQPLVARRED